MPEANHVKFARSLVKQFGRVKAKEILEFMIKEGGEHIKPLGEAANTYLYSERITAEQLHNEDWRSTQRVPTSNKPN